MRVLHLYALLLVMATGSLLGQVTNKSGIDINPNKKYEIGGVRVTGGNDLDKRVVTLISGLEVGKKINLPGEATTKAIENLWRQKLFDDIGIFVTEITGNVVFLEIRLKALPKLSKYGIQGLKKSDRNDLREELDLSSGKVVTQNLIVTTENKAEKYFRINGYLNADVEVSQQPDTAKKNAVILNIKVDKGEKVKIADIFFYGNKKLSDRDLRKSLEETKRARIWNIFKSSKFIRKKYEEDKQKLIDAYNSKGFRNARIIKDSIYQVKDDRVAIAIWVEEGQKFYFGDINWLGNTKYSDQTLRNVLNIDKGDVYDAAYLQERLFMDKQGNDVSSLYLNNGYLFFNLNPVEVQVRNDTIDLEMRIQEGQQATIDEVTVSGNDRTNDHVILRELRTRPGELFRRSNVQRSLRELQQLGFFDPRQLNVNPVPDAETGTVDIEYEVTEQSTSQLQLQGGWGAGRIVGTLGLNFNNFSARNFFKKGAWKPLPAGDGQTISLRAQSNGRFFQSYNASFTEPWLGGKKPNSFTVSVYHNIQNLSGLPRDDDDYQGLTITGATVSLGQRLKWPDDYFTLRHSLDLQRYRLVDYSLASINFQDGFVNNLSYTIALGRNSVDYPIFPRKGSLFNLSMEMTPPYSLFNDKNYDGLPPSERYQSLEYYKLKFDTKWYTEIFDKTVFKVAAEFGSLGTYNTEVGLPPFERFYLGGDGLQNFVLDGREIIRLRGYPNNSLVPVTPTGRGGTVYNKYTMELRYLITENPSAQIFALTFMEAGNNFDRFENYRPFSLKRSAGAGVRIFMPMFGLLGVDFGYGFDPLPNNPGTPSGWQTHFMIGQQF
ncbi:MAG: outer membrane protein assembly factor BamA [Schleiferiaceae bacterium]|nr:outer membrane protein assembly factor BamA [Schleiferiaceae bacterium]